MKNLLTFLPAFLIASTVVAEPTAAKYFATKVTTDSGYTQTLMLPDGTLEYVVAFTTVNDESNPHTWEVPANVKDSIDYLVVAGGGGGGTGSNGGGGGGGGAGGMLTGTLNSISESAYLTIVVGAGGAGGSGGNKVANNGENSFIRGATDIIAIGGGAGGSAYSQDVANGSAGGNGGGGAGTGKKSAQKPATGGEGVQGNKGGDRVDEATDNRPGAGGGGAGEAGDDTTGSGFRDEWGTACSNADGGDGLPSLILGTEVWYAGGGGGGSYGANNAAGGIGGSGGGGRYASSGTVATGGGGGGARGTNNGGNGGNGIVVLRYALDNDNFQGIVVHHTTTEKFGTPSPAYDIYKTIPSDVYTCSRFSDVSQGVRAVCVGWELWSKDGAATEPIRVFTDDYRTTGRTSDLTYSRESGDEGVVLKWKFVKEYYVSTVVSCERGSLVADKSGWYREGDTIQVAITSMDNFIGWGGWGTGAQRSLEQSKTITVVAAPMTITAYFTANDKDNLILNGDFEINNNSSHSTKIVQNFDRLMAGSWSIRQDSTYWAYPTGILAAHTSNSMENKSYGSKLRAYNGGGLSCQIASSTAQARQDAFLGCYINVPCAGIYDFSFMNATSSSANSPTWKVEFQFIPLDEEGVPKVEKKEMVLLNQQQKMSTWCEYSSADNFDSDNQYPNRHLSKVTLRKAGIYQFKIYLSKVNIVSNNAISAFDNIELKLDKRLGFFIKVR